MHKIILPVLISVLASTLPAQSVVARIQSASIAASARITLQLKDATLEESLREITRQSGMRLFFSKAAVPVTRRINVNVSNVSLDEALDAVTRGTGTTAHIAGDGRTITVAMVKKGATAQGIIVGKVTDAKSGKGVSGANISISNSNRGVVTGEDGSYKLTGISAGTHTVSVRLVGYAKQTRSVSVGEGSAVVVDFRLEPAANVLDQVIVTGTVVATELKAVPNAITVITAKQIEERGITRIDQLFRGDIPGLFSLNLGSQSILDEVSMFSRGATALSNESAGVDPNINTTNSIKTYVDGIELSDSRYLSQIDPSSIERIEILTGPQASTIYGSNAINGVMQVFTKRGSGNRPQFKLSLTSGVTQNNFSSAVAPAHLADANLSGSEGKWSYNVGGSWNYAGSWTPGKQTQRLSAYGSGRMDLGKLTADLSARQGSTKNKQNGSVEQGGTYLRSTGVYVPSSSAGLPIPQTHTLNGRTVSISLAYRPLSWWSQELVVGSDVSATESIKTAPEFKSGANGGDTTLSINAATVARRSERYNSTIQLPVSALAKLNLVFGADHWRTSGSSWRAFPLALTGSFSNSDQVRVIRNRPEKNTGAYVQGQLGFFDALFFTYGMRGDWNPHFGDDVKVKPGRYGVSYSRDLGAVSAKLRGSYGRSIRPPLFGITRPITLSELGFDDGFIELMGFGNYDFQKGNPDLGPEHQQGGEGGVELYLGNRGSIVITRFNQTVDNLISNIPSADSVRSLSPVAPNVDFCEVMSDGVVTFDAQGHCFRYQSQFLNVGSIRNQGWETQGSVNIGPFNARGTYSWVKSRILGVTPKYRATLNGSRYQPGLPFDFLPEHTWALELKYTQAKSTMSLAINGIGERYLSGTSNDDVTMASSIIARVHISRPRMDLGSYHARGAGYATADLIATHGFSSRVDGLLQINNLTNYYQNDFSAVYASIGRSSRMGLRLRW